MPFFRKKPITIEAIQWTGNNLLEIVRFTGQNASADNPYWDDYVEIVKRHGLVIPTLEGSMLASIGDWVIKGVNGEFYPCKPDIFEKTYEVVV